MYRNELERLIKSGTKLRGIMLYGECHFLIEYYLKHFSNIPDANMLSLYHDEYEFTAAKAHISQGSLFGGENVLIIKSEKKLPKKELDILLSLVQKNPDNTFIYAYYGPDMKTSAKAFNKKSGGIEVRLFSPYPNEAKAMLLQEAQRLQVQLDGYSANHLIESQNGDLSLAFNELKKLQILGRPITTKDIDTLVYGVGEVKIDQFINHLLDKKDFREEVQRILESGVDEIRIITAISAHLSQLFLFYSQIKVNGVGDSRAVLGFKLPPKIEQARAQQSIRLKQYQYEQVLQLLIECELQMKSSGGMDKTALLLATLIKLQSYL